MENFFGIENEIISRALKEGILIEVNNKFIPNIGTISLVYHPQIRRFVLVFGNSAENAGFVLLEDHKKTWKLKSYGKEN